MIVEVKVPQVGESITEVVMGEWKINDGDFVDIDDTLCTIESEKAAMDIVAENAGTIKIKANTGDTLPIGALIAEIDTSAQGGTEKEEQPEQQTEPEPAQTGETGKETKTDAKLFITPVAKKMLAEAGIDPAKIKGSGPVGKITKADAQKAIEGKTTDTAEPAPSAPTPKAAPPSTPATAAADRDTTREPMSTLRRTIASHLVAAKNETAMLTTINEVDMSAIIQLRKDLKEEFLNKYGVKLGFMSLFAKAACIALKEMPVVNARIEGNDIIYHHFCDLSIAVSTPRGLVVPVIRNAESKNAGQLETDIQSIAVKARDGKLTIQEMTGGTFTITNGGVFGSLISTPIINTPQSAVLGMHTIQERPIALNGQVVIRPMMYLSLSYDHRIIDGRESVLFLVHLKNLLENPNRMLLEL